MKRNKSNFMAIASAFVLSIASIGIAGFNVSNQVSAAELCSPSATTISAAVCMQDINDSVIESMTLEEQYQLTDSRDGKIYYVAKLQDGHVWMTQNLALGLADGISLNSQNTDLTDHSLTGAYESGYTYDEATGIITWTPASTANTIILTGNRAEAWVQSNTEPYSARKSNDGSTGHDSLGNYYNWNAAIASNDSSALTSSTRDNVANNPKNSVCPKGWRLPTISNESGSTAGSTNEFGRLNAIYNNNSQTKDTGLVEAPLLFVRAGIVISGSITSIGDAGVYHSSTVYDEDMAMYLGFDSTSVRPNSSYYAYRAYGRSVRCVARGGINPEDPSDPSEDPTEEDTEDNKGAVSAPDTGANLETSDFSNGSAPILGILISSIVAMLSSAAFHRRAEEDDK